MTDGDDPLKSIALEFSEEMDDLDRQDPNETSGFQSNLDQTIIIGEMEEGNIFDDLKLADSSKPDDDSITITKHDLKDLIDNIKVQHRAEIDAIMLE